MKIVSLFRFLFHLSYVKRQFKRCKNHLAPGRYILLPCMRAFSMDEREVLDFAEKYFSEKNHSRIKLAIVSVLNRVGAFTNKKREGKYQALYIANNYDKVREIKLFSFCEKKILTICTSSASFEKQMDQFKRLSATYNMPSAMLSPDCENSYEIDMIEFLPRPNALSALRDIVNAHKRTSATGEAGSASFSRILDAAKNNIEYLSIVRAVAEKLSPSSVDTVFPFRIQHGDLSQDNLFYGSCKGEEGYWWIDWEHENLRLFFYDFYFYIVNSAYCTHDPEPLHVYLRGECDDMLTEWFALNSVQYCDNRRAEYLWVFFLSFLNERIHTIDAAQKYFSFLETELQDFQVGK